MTSGLNEIKNYQDCVQKFSQLVFEKTTDYRFLLDIASTVGINSVFSCPLFWVDDATNIRQSTFDRTTFLFIALFYKNEDVIRLLLDNGADPNGRDGYGEPPIWDLQYEYEDPQYGLRVARILLEHGADPNIKYDNEGFYYYVDTKPADIIQNDAEFRYLNDLCSLLEEFGGEY